MAETITAEEWIRLGRLTEAQLREVASKQLAITVRAREAVSIPQKLVQLLAGARADLERGDTAAAGSKREAYNGAISKARWLLDDLGPLLRSAGQGSLFDQLDAAARRLVPVQPGTPPPPKPDEKKPSTSDSKTPPKSQARQALEALLPRGSVELRRLAVAQRDSIAAKLEKARGPIGSALGRWPVWDRQIERINATIRAGDEIPASEADAERVRSIRYAGALLLGQEAARDLDRDIKEGGTAELFLRGSVEGLEDAAKKTGTALEETARQAGSTLQTVAWILAGGAAIGLALAVASRLGSKEETPAPGPPLPW